MGNKKLTGRIASKQKDIEEACVYGFAHFCDGKPNTSADGVDKNTEPKPKCPEYHKCEIRKRSIFDKSWGRGDD